MLVGTGLPLDEKPMLAVLMFHSAAKSALSKFIGPVLKMNNNKTTKMVLLALLIANIVLVRFGAIYLGPSLRVTFGFIPIVMMGILFGPISAAVGAGLRLYRCDPFPNRWCIFPWIYP